MATPDLQDIEARFQKVDETLAAIERRLGTLELRASAWTRPLGTPAEDDTPRAVPTPQSETGAGRGERLDLPLALSLTGRVLMVLGGAFLLRAITDAGWIPRSGGVAVGLAYAATWLAAADRAGARERRWSALSYGAAGIAIAFSLVAEAATRFALLGSWAGTAALVVAAGIGLGIAWHRGLQALAGFTTLGALATAVVLMTAGSFTPVTIALIVLGVATLWVSYDRDWFWIRWPTAIVADLAAIGLTTRALNAQPLEPAGAVMAVQILLLAAYLASFTARTLLRGRSVVPFEVIQTVAALGIGLGGAVVVARASGRGDAALGVASILLAAGCYAAAFAFIGRRQGLGDNFYFYATLGLVLTLTGCGVTLAVLPCTMALAALAVATTWLGHRLSRQTLIGHGAVYALAAAIVSGLLEVSGAALAGTPASWALPGAAPWIAWLASAACLAVLLGEGAEPATPFGRLPWVAIAAMAAVGTGAMAIIFLGPVIAGRPPDPATLAALRTAVVAVAAVLLAWATRSPRAWELGWLLYPVLGLGAVKLLVEDIPRSRPTTLFIALALFGAALVAAPRLTKRAPPRSAS